MSVGSRIRNYALSIALVVATLALFSALYEHWFSDTATLVRTLQKQIEEKEAALHRLELEYGQLIEEEQERLQQIAALKSELARVKQAIEAGGSKLNEIKDQIIDIQSALDIIEDHTRRGLERGRVVLPRGDGGSGN